MVSILRKTEVIDSSPKYQLYKMAAIFCRHKSHRRKTEGLLLSSGQYTRRGYWHLKYIHLSVKELFPWLQITAAPDIIVCTLTFITPQDETGPVLAGSSLWIEGWFCRSQDWWSVFLRQTSEPKNWLIYHLRVVEFMKRRLSAIFVNSLHCWTLSWNICGKQAHFKKIPSHIAI